LLSIGRDGESGASVLTVLQMMDVLLLELVDGSIDAVEELYL
jgi:hypothetical protein